MIVHLLAILIFLTAPVWGQPSPDFPDNSFALYAMAHPSGVSEPTRQARQRILSLMEESRQRGEVLSLTQTRLGFEGAMRICATFATPDAARAAWEQAHQFADGVELATLVVEPCNK